MLSRNDPVESSVADDAVKPVVWARIEIAGASVCVARAPASEKNFAYIGNIVAIGILQEQRVWSLVNNDTAMGKCHARRNAQLFSEDGEFVGFAIFVCVFANSNPVATFAFRLAFIRIVISFSDP